MNHFDYKKESESDGAEEIYSKIVRAGRRTYFFDVKATRNDDYYVTVTESRKKTEKDGKFSFEKHKIHLYKDPEHRDGDLYRGDCISFRTEAEFRRFLSDYEGTVFAALNPKSVIVWCYRDEQKAVPQQEWDALDAPVSVRRIYNAPQPVKLVKDHERHTTVCYYIRPDFSHK